MPSNLPWSRERPSKLRYRFHVVEAEHPELFEFLWGELGGRAENHVIVALLEAGRAALLSPPNAAAAREGSQQRTASSRSARRSVDGAKAIAKDVTAPSYRQSVERGAGALLHPSGGVPTGDVAGEPVIAGERVSSGQTAGGLVASVEAFGSAPQPDAGSGTAVADVQRSPRADRDGRQGLGSQLGDGSDSWGDDLEGGLGKSATDLVNQFF